MRVGRTIEVSSVEQLTSAQCEKLMCGGTVIKKDSSGKHAYTVTYKKDGVGLCLTYADAENVETVSYDKTENCFLRQNGKRLGI